MTLSIEVYGIIIFRLRPTTHALKKDVSFHRHCIEMLMHVCRCLLENKYTEPAIENSPWEDCPPNENLPAAILLDIVL